MCISALSVCMCTTGMPRAHAGHENVGFHRTAVADECEPSGYRTQVLNKSSQWS